MKKADILNVIKDAEELAEAEKKKAMKTRDINLNKARGTAQGKLEEGRTKAKQTYETIIEKAKEDISREKQVMLARSEKRISELKAKSKTAVDGAVNHLISEFERATNV